MKKIMPFLIIIVVVIFINNKLGGSLEGLINTSKVAFDFLIASILSGTVLGLLLFKEIRKKGVLKSAVIFGAVVVFMSIYL